VEQQGNGRRILQRRCQDSVQAQGDSTRRWHEDRYAVIDQTLVTGHAGARARLGSSTGREVGGRLRRGGSYLPASWTPLPTNQVIFTGVFATR
jgi:hypothetical protein